MKVSVDGQEVFTLSEIQKQVIRNDIPDEIFEDDMKRRLGWIILDRHYNVIFNELKKEWSPKLIASGASQLPTNQDAFVALVFAHPDYKDASRKFADEKAAQAEAKRLVEIQQVAIVQAQAKAIADAAKALIGK